MGSMGSLPVLSDRNVILFAVIISKNKRQVFSDNGHSF